MDADRINQLGHCFEKEAAALVLYARQWLDASSAEDAVQDAFLNLMRYRRWPENPRAWLYRAVRHRALKGLRSSRRRNRREDQAAANISPCLEPGYGEGLDAQEVARALGDLPEGEREAVTLRIWGALTLAEVAEVIGTSVPTAFRRYRSGLTHLRQRLEIRCRKTIH